MKKIFILFIISFSAFLLSAQVENSIIQKDSTKSKPEIKVIAAYLGDSMIIRWAPTDVDGWLMGYNRGFNIKRLELNDSLIPISKWQKLNKELIFPYSIQKFKKIFEKDDTDDYMLIAAESLYGKYGISGKTEIKPKSMAEMMLEAEDFKSRFAMCLLASDFSAQAAKSMGFRWVDNTVSKGKIYMYLVSSPYVDSAKIQLEEAYISIDTKKEYNVYPMVSKVDELENQVNLLLDREFHQKYFTGFWIEKSIDNGMTYQRLNKLPYLNPLTNQKGIGNRDYIVYTDTFPENYILALYRVIGLTPFATQSKPSKPVKAIGRDKTPPALPDSVKTEMLSTDSMKISWYYNKIPDDLKGFYITKSDKPYAGFDLMQEEMLSKDTRVYIDTNPDLDLINYYSLICVDTAGNASMTNAAHGYYIDSVPPEIPKNLSGSIDTNGVVTVVWDKGKEHDIHGYFVYMSNSKDHVFSNMTGKTIPDTVFRDTINLMTLTEEIYYKIIAVDHNFNESGFSEVLMLKKPDLLPPTPPLLIEAKLTESSVALTYKKSHSKDVEYYYLLRKNITENWDTIQIHHMDSIPDLLVDQDLKPNTKYNYALIAKDDDGNFSNIAYRLSVRTKRIIPKGKFTFFDAIVKDKTVELKWIYVGRADDRIMIYRKTDKGKVKLLKNIKADNEIYTDTRVKENKVYKYFLGAETKGGRQLSFSKKKIVQCSIPIKKSGK